MTSPPSLPETMKALVLTSTSSPPTIQEVPTPQPTIGTAVVRVLAIATISYTRDVLNGVRAYPFPTPLIPGSSAIARVAAVGPDATSLQPGDLVQLDVTVRSRDDPSDVFLAGIHEGFTPGSRKLMKDVYRDWTFAEFCRAPLENLTRLDEQRLQTLGYEPVHLAAVSRLLVPFGGLRDVELRAGQTVVVAPATGPFGGAAVQVALSMGARVIAMGRNTASLAALKERVPFAERVVTVPVTGDVQADCAALKAHGPIDAFFDIGPPEAHASSHIKSCILALRHGGRVSLMGGYREDVAIPHGIVMHRNIRLYGKWMYKREDIGDLFRLVESGVLKLGEEGGFKLCGRFKLEEWKEALDAAAEKTRFGEGVVIEP